MARHKPKPLFWLALVVIIACGAYAASLFKPASDTHRDVEVTIHPGNTLARIARRLERRHLIRSAAVFRLVAKLQGSGEIKAGTYTLSPDMSPGRILDELEKGVPEQLVRVTFPEGFTLEQVADRASEMQSVSRSEFVRLATMRGRSFTAPYTLPDNLEGYLYPDTYDFKAKKTTAHDVIQEMLDTFGRKVAEPFASDLRASAGQGYDLAKIVTLASLIEREAKVKKDQATIAGVLYNRLRLGMPLQVDATVQYVIGHKERLLYSDLEVNSPYNTYKFAGLPPGPICNPGLEAIRAALHPAKVPYLYYTAKADGSHTFTTTLSEHVRATQQARAEMKAHAGG